MGRKGVKGFLKGVHKNHGSDDEAGETSLDEPSSSATKPAATTSQPSAHKAKQPAITEPADKADGGGDDSGDEGDGNKGPETRGQMLQRHKREIAAHKKTVQKLGSKKKDDAAKLTVEIEARHARELAEVEERQRQGGQEQQPTELLPPGADEAPEQLRGLGLAATHAAEAKKPTKAQKRREKQAEQDAERELRIASEQAAMGPSDRAVEEEQLNDLLLPLRLSIREIRADGHCLFRSIQDQLTQAAAVGSSGGAAAGTSGAVQDYLALRRLAASHIRSHPHDFLPFIYDEGTAGSAEEQLESYCQELEGTAVWGGQLELGALAQVLKKQIKVYAAGLPTVTLGDEFAGAGVLQLCYLRHAFGLGEHYNSVVPLAASVGAGQGEGF